MLYRTAIMIEVDDDLIEAIVRFVADAGTSKSPAEAIQAVLSDWALAHGHMPVHLIRQDNDEGNSA